MRDLFMLPQQIADINPQDHLNFQELTLLVGLFVKTAIEFQIPAEEVSSERFGRTYQLFEELHKKYHDPFLKELASKLKHGHPTETRQENYRRIFGAGTMVTEPMNWQLFTSFTV